MMMMGWKCHAKVFALPPCSYSPRKFTSINYIPSSSFKYNSNNIQLSSRWLGTIVSAWDGTPAVQPIGTMLCFQVGCSDRERVLQRKLNHIAEVADTSTLNGLNYILKEVVKALIQQNETSFHFSNLFIEYDSMESLSKRFLQIINRERDKYGQDVETFVNVDGVKYKNCMVEANSSNIENEYTLATVSVLATGKHLIPSTNKKRQVYLDTAAVLQTLISIPKTEIQSVEVLWSPQKEDHVLLKEPRMLKEEPGRDYPKLIGLDTKGRMTRIYMQ
ncbi:hypothetical protein POM88_023016 [Heracleum sosnowskyi]|uniref:Uncharacterized protein n=1 Tax=Heracleum sosnowskyi TaxID=360622 RepID=A0AAD8IGV0_9APIA|nr:hypothetical protein POM88_023016 [Heracleum sosnowskyi]